MSNYPFLELELKLPDGSIMTLGDHILIVDGALVLVGRIAWIDASAIDVRVPGGMPTIDVAIDDVLSHKLNSGIPPNINKQRTGYRYIKDPHPRGNRFGKISRADYELLKAWHDEHGATGGSGDKDQRPNPGEIPFEPTGTGEGKLGETGGDPTGGAPVGEQGGGKETGEGGITGAPDDRTDFHPADTNRDGFIDRDEKKAWNKKNPNDPVEKGKA